MTTIPALKFRNEMGEMLDQVRINKEPLIITKHEKPIAIVLALDLINLKKSRKDSFFDLSLINKKLVQLIGRGAKVSLAHEKLFIKDYLGRKI